VNARAWLKTCPVALLAVLGAACGGSMDVTVYEPGVYKGSEDPLVAMHAAPEQKAALQARFTKSQADR
jgi:hypothetical protein